LELLTGKRIYWEPFSVAGRVLFHQRSLRITLASKPTTLSCLKRRAASLWVSRRRTSKPAYRKEHPAEGTGAIFRNLISAKEKQHMGDLLGAVNPSLDEQIPFDGSVNRLSKIR